MMQSRLIADQHSERTYILVFETDDEVIHLLEAFAREHALSAARITAIGAFRDVTLGYFDWERKDYKTIPIDEQVEVLSLIGDIALKDDEPTVHVHVVVGRSDGTTRGGHLLGAHVRPTLEVMLIESPAHLCKQHDPASGLALIQLQAEPEPSGAGRQA